MKTSKTKVKAPKMNLNFFSKTPQDGDSFIEIMNKETLGAVWEYLSEEEKINRKKSKT